MMSADISGTTVQPHSRSVLDGNPKRITKAATSTGTTAADTHRVGASTRSSRRAPSLIDITVAVLA